MPDFEIVEAFHEPDWSAELQLRAMEHDRAKLELRAPGFMVTMRDSDIVETFHEPP